MISRLLASLTSTPLHWDKQSAPRIQATGVPDTLKMQLSVGTSSNQVIVRRGDWVGRGQALTESDNLLIPPIFAGSSGTITDVGSTSIDIETDGKDSWAEPSLQPEELDRSKLTAIAHRAGLIGHGGGGFPVAAKLNAAPEKIDLLLVNAAECDPLIYCDDALVQSESESIVESILTIARVCQIKEICIGIEDNKPDTVNILRNLITTHSEATDILRLAIVPSRYPSGAEKTLLRNCTNHVPLPGRNLAASGILSMNIASCHAVGQVLKSGYPCTERVTTLIAPDGSIHNVLARLGAPVSFLYQFLDTQVPFCSVAEITVGGSMMFDVINTDYSVTQTYNSISFRDKISIQPESKPCIRCGVCAEVCPEKLMPQNLHRFSDNFDHRQLRLQRLDRCIECRSCDIVCPSKIPLTSQFQHAKRKVSAKIKAEADAELAKTRYEKHGRRIAGEIQARDGQKARRSKSAIATQRQANDNHKALIAAALARNQQKKNRNTPT